MQDNPVKKVSIDFRGQSCDFTYYQSWMDTGHHIFFILTGDEAAVKILHLDHFFIDIDLNIGGKYCFNVIENTAEEVEFKDVIAAKIIDHHYSRNRASTLN